MLHQIPTVDIQNIRQILIQDTKQHGSFKAIHISGAEIVNGTVVNIMLLQRIFDCTTAICILIHHQELRIWQGCNQPPEIRITGYKDKGVDSFRIVILANTCGHDDIHQALSLGYTIYDNMLDRNRNKLRQPPPAHSCMMIVI